MARVRGSWYVGRPDGRWLGPYRSKFEALRAVAARGVSWPVVWSEDGKPPTTAKTR
jgi:hypothetical protein